MADITLPPPVTPHSLGPPPRQVRPRKGHQESARSLWLILTPLTGFVLFFVFWKVLFVAATALFGASYPGTIISIIPDGASEGTSMHLVNYTFQADGVIQHDSARINENEKAKLASQNPPIIPTAPIAVQYFRIGPLSKNYVHQLPRNSPEQLMCWVPCGVFLILFAYLFWWALLIHPRRVRWLYQYGTAVPGTILAKSMEVDSENQKHNTHYITYTFTHPLTGEPLTHKSQDVKKGIWLHITENQPVTVLCHPTNPKRSVVYELGEFKVLP